MATRFAAERLSADVLGCRLDLFDGWPRIVRAVEHILGQGRGGYAVAVNPEKVMRAQRDPAVLSAINGAHVTYADGVGVVWAALVKHGRRIPRLPGCELAERVLELCEARSYGVYLLGAREAVVAAAAAYLVRTYPAPSDRGLA